MKSVCVTSGGGDSIVNGLMLLKDGYEVHFLNVMHGQKCELAERLSCINITERLKDLNYNCELHTIEIPWLGQLGGSGLTDRKMSVPGGLDGVYNSTIGKIFTPARNVVLLSLAASLSERLGIEYITLGCNQSEIGYLDNTKTFLDAYTEVLKYGCYHIHPQVISPIWELDKVEIYKWAFDTGFGWVLSELTWSCDDSPTYIGGSISNRKSYVSCGKCGCCRNRRLVFYILDMMYPKQQYLDRQTYLDEQWFWKDLLPTIRKRGIPMNKWFSSYAEVLQCKIIR